MAREEAADGQTVAARRIERDATQAEAFAELVAPAVDRAGCRG